MYMEQPVTTFKLSINVLLLLSAISLQRWRVLEEEAIVKSVFQLRRCALSGQWGNASWSLNNVLPFLSFFGCHTGFWSRCPGVKFVMSSRHGRERNGSGLWTGKHPRNCCCVCRYDVMVPFGSLPYHRRGGLWIWWLSGDLQVCVV